MTNLRLATATQNALADALTVAIDAGTAATIKLYTGTQPATANTALSGNTLLATFTLDDPSFGAASAGVITLAGVPRTTTGVAAGTATFFRCETGTGAAKVLDGDVGTSAATLILNTTTISVGVDVSITAGTLTVPAG
jgi:hypothetical protein